MEEIKKATDEELKKRYVALSVCMNYCVSSSDCLWQLAMEEELSRRKVNFVELDERIAEGIGEVDEWIKKEGIKR